ncbi:CHAD domain-containing protein [Nocardia harenae]|uniref:CHAD domain-containing protein n=1 Tax=Nocardia harenae TaxID=358707 RepID=UPI0009FCD964|nr:CHAD domain-containing protein [Nocardia harenae]
MTATAGAAAVTALGEDTDRLLAAEPDVRADAPDSVHQMRVATRRLRSVLRSYRTLFAAEPAAALGAELKWLAGVLGEARDAEVRAERFAGLVQAHSKRGTVRRDALAGRLVRAERDRYAAAHAAVLEALDGERYAALHAELARWRSGPPLLPTRSQLPAPQVFEGILRADRKRLTKKAGKLDSVSGAERIELLHDIRKSAKRLRYSCEAATETIGDEAAAAGNRAKKVQTVLGDHRDAVESREAILVRAQQAEADGGARKIYASLARAERKAAKKALAKYPAALAKLKEHGHVRVPEKVLTKAGAPATNGSKPMPATAS